MPALKKCLPPPRFHPPPSPCITKKAWVRWVCVWCGRKPGKPGQAKRSGMATQSRGHGFQFPICVIQTILARVGPYLQPIGKVNFGIVVVPSARTIQARPPPSSVSPPAAHVANMQSGWGVPTPDGKAGHRSWQQQYAEVRRTSAQPSAAFTQRLPVLRSACGAEHFV